MKMFFNFVLKYSVVLIALSACQSKGFAFKEINHQRKSEKIMLNDNEEELQEIFSFLDSQYSIVCFDRFQIDKEPLPENIDAEIGIKPCGNPFVRYWAEECHLKSGVSYENDSITGITQLYDFNTNTFLPSKFNILKSMAEELPISVFYNEEKKIILCLLNGRQSKHYYYFGIVVNLKEKRQGKPLYVVAGYLRSEYDHDERVKNQMAFVKKNMKDCQNRWFRLAEQLCKSKN